MSSIETWQVPETYLAHVDRQLITAADQELAAAEEVCRQAAAELDRAHDAVAAASAEFEQLRRRAADGMAISSAEIANIYRATVDGGTVKAFRSDALDAARTAREAARAAHAVKIAQAHTVMGEKALAAIFRACRASDLSLALYSSPTGGDEGRRIARKPRFDSDMAESRVAWEGAMAALYRAVRAGFRGCPETFPATATWPCSEVIARQACGRLPPTEYRNTMSPDEKLGLVRRYRGEMLDPARRIPQHNAVQERARVLRKKAEQVLDDGDLNRTPAILAELSVATLAFKEIVEAELVAA